MITIRPFTSQDFPQWLPLWIANNDGKRNETVTTETWTRIIDPESSVFGLGAFRGDRLVGLLHYVLHPTTGSIEPICYMQDVFIDKTQRRNGFAKALIIELAKIGQAANWNRIYWLAEQNNDAAQNLYKTLGLKLDFTLHVWPLGMLKK